MKNKNTFAVLAIVAAGLTLAVPAYAKEAEVRGEGERGERMEKMERKLEKRGEKMPMGKPFFRSEDKNLRASTTMKMKAPIIENTGQPVVAGSVVSLNGNTFSISAKGGVTYSIDASNAKIVKVGVATSTISNIVVGDHVVVQGAVNGTSVVATSVFDGAGKASASENASFKKPKHGGFLGGIARFFGF